VILDEAHLIAPEALTDIRLLAWIPMKGIDIKICPAGWGGRKP